MITQKFFEPFCIIPFQDNGGSEAKQVDVELIPKALNTNNVLNVDSPSVGLAGYLNH